MKYEIEIKVLPDGMSGREAPKDVKKYAARFRLYLSADGDDDSGGWAVTDHALRKESGTWTYAPSDGKSYSGIQLRARGEPPGKVLMTLVRSGDFPLSAGEWGRGGISFRAGWTVPDNAVHWVVRAVEK